MWQTEIKYFIAEKVASDIKNIFHILKGKPMWPSLRRNKGGLANSTTFCLPKNDGLERFILSDADHSCRIYKTFLIRGILQ